LEPETQGFLVVSFAAERVVAAEPVWPDPEK
jgi:hypothetical protein